MIEMEGDKEDIVEVEPIYGERIPKKNIKNFEREILIIFAVAIIIGLIMGSLIWFFILQPKPIYQQYEKYDRGSTTIYENKDLNVKIIESPDNEGSKDYYVEWINIYGEEESHFSHSKELKTIFDNKVLIYSYKLSINQIKWFEYMCKNVI